MLNMLTDDRLSSDLLPIFETFYSLLIQENQKINLTRLIEKDEFTIQHVMDSLSLLQCLPQQEGVSILDLGTGGGFPGIPLWIVNPHWAITLVDATGKKIKAVEKICRSLQAQYPQWLNTLPTCLHARAEQLGQDTGYREQFDYVVSRAVAPLPTLLELCLPLVKVHGSMIAMKGVQYEKELNQMVGEPCRTIDRIVALLGATREPPRLYQLPGGIQRILLILKKCQPTPDQYPRSEGVPHQKPLQ